MRSMADRKPTDRTAAGAQPDLFDERSHAGERRLRRGNVADEREKPAAGELSDDELLRMLPKADMSDVDALCSEIVSRSLQEAVPVLESLWRRFVGFGVETPLPEQRTALGALALLDGEAARAALERIVLSDRVSGSLLPVALRAAADAGLSLPAGFLAPCLGHEDAAVRAPAFELALQARGELSSHLFRDGLADPVASIRRRAAIAMGVRGDGEARAHLIGELARDPSTDVIEALAAIWNDDVIVHLGRCAGRHPALGRVIVDVLRDIDSPKASRLADGIEADTPR